MKKIIVFFHLLLCGMVIAQNNNTITNPKKYFIDAQRAISFRNYHDAIEPLTKLLLANPNNAHVNYLLGLCYLNSTFNKKLALNYLIKATEKVSENFKERLYEEQNAPLEAWFFLGKAYHANFMFDKAIECFNTYKILVANNNNKTKLAIRNIEICNNAKTLVNDSIPITIINMGKNINSEYEEHSPVINADENILIFTSNRKNSTGGLLTNDGNYFEDIYISKKINNEWTVAEKISPLINTSGHEASVALTSDVQQLFIYKDDFGIGNIYQCNKDGDEWSLPIKLSSTINSGGNETHITVSNDGSIMYFASDRKGGYGGRDIYSSKKLPNGEWGLPVNLGPIINTEYDEEGPFLHPDGFTLYFSSTGHNTIGGYDLFYSICSDSNTWSNPINMGYPINTLEDDVFFTLSVDGKRAYYSTQKSNGLGGRDIYMMNFLSLSERALAVIKGVVRIAGQNEVPKEIVLTLEDISTGELVGRYLPNKNSGEYIIIVKQGKEYKITCEALKCKLKKEILKVPEYSSFFEIQKPIYLSEITELDPASIFQINYSGKIKDAKTGEFIKAEIEVVDNTEKILISTTYSDTLTGSFLVTLPVGRNFGIAVKADNYLFYSENINIPDTVVYSEIKKEILLNKITTGSKIILNNIFFDYAKATLQAESTFELDRIALLMKKYKTLKIEISGHTDNQSSFETNQKLSEARAKSVVDYLIANGIEPERLSYKGYAFTQPIATNDTEEGRQKNRRVEFKIISK